MEKLHIVAFPWLAFGHMIPFLELAKCLASHGHRISFISTPRNLQRLPKIPQNLAPLINLVSLPLPETENLPLDAEATSDVPFDKIEFLKKAYDGLQEPMERFLEASRPTDWIIYDFSNYWLPPIADRLGIRKVFFSLINAWSLSVFGPSKDMIKDGADSSTWNSPEDMTRPFKWVPFPNDVVFRLHEAKKTFSLARKNASGVSDIFRCGSSMRGCDVLAVRSCNALEAEYLELLEKLHGKPVVPVGLLPVSVEGQGEQETWQSVIGWLDKQRKGSVVYVALGSEVAPSQEQITELALGLGMSELPFFWVFRKPAGTTVELPEGFEDQTKGRGLVWTSWAPQPRILAHDSVGGFLTHCGWSSIIEGLQFGRPLIMLPFGIDQGVNARVLAGKKVGIEIPRNDEDGSFTRSSVAETLKMLLEDEAGKIYRDEAEKISGIVADKNLQSQYVDKFEEYLRVRKPVREA